MRKFLLALCFSTLSLVAAADDLPAIAGLRAFRAPMTEIVRETGKGQEADFASIEKSWAEADQVWKQMVKEPLDLNRYGVPAASQEEAWRQVRLLEMLIGYIGEAAKRHDRSLLLRSVAMLTPAYDKLAATLRLY